MPEKRDGVSLDERWRRIDGLELEPMVFKLVNAEQERDRLTLAAADEAVDLYRAFLKLVVAYPDKAIVPTKQIDAVWHAHLSDTAKYRQDCDHIAGGPLDHWPYAGTMGPDDEKRLADNFAATRDMFYGLFGVNLTAGPDGDAASCGPVRCATCECDRANVTDRVRPVPDRAALA